MADLEIIHGRGASANPGNRFESLHYAVDEDVVPEERPAPATQFYRDQSKSIIATNDSPDVGFSASINPYRGCEHGCIYCYARPSHEYLGLSAGLDFETRIMVKEDAPNLLRKELSARKWQPQTLAISGVTDPYQPIERRLQLTRRCLEVLAEFRNPAGVITKNHLVTRDADILGRMAAWNGASAALSVTTLDAEIGRVMEPRASHPAGRLKAIRELTDAGVPVSVMVAPVVPGLTDHEIPSILEACRDAGALSAGMVLLRLPFAVGPLFEKWVEQHFPQKADKVLGRIRAMRGGQLYDSSFGSRMTGEGQLAETIQQMFAVACKRLGLVDRKPLSKESFRRPDDTPAALFES